jgi:hypothetical protein
MTFRNVLQNPPNNFLFIKLSFFFSSEKNYFAGKNRTNEKSYSANGPYFNAFAPITKKKKQEKIYCLNHEIIK